MHCSAQYTLQWNVQQRGCRHLLTRAHAYKSGYGGVHSTNPTFTHATQSAIGQAFQGKVQIDKVSFSDGSVTSVAVMPLEQAAGPGVITWFDLPASASLDGTKELLHGRIFSDTTSAGHDGGASSSSPAAAVCDNIIALTTPGKMGLPLSTVNLKTAGAPNADGSVDITVSSDNFALYVTLTTLANGRFSDNAFMLTQENAAAEQGVLQRVIQFIPFNGSADVALLASSVRVEHVAAYMF